MPLEVAYMYVFNLWIANHILIKERLLTKVTLPDEDSILSIIQRYIAEHPLTEVKLGEYAIGCSAISIIQRSNMGSMLGDVLLYQL